jgi:hypothetical protein
MELEFKVKETEKEKDFFQDAIQAESHFFLTEYN